MRAALRISLCFRRRGSSTAPTLLLALAAGSWPGSGLIASQVHAVVIESMAFNPATLTVEQGDTVVWINRDLFVHNATAEDGAFCSGDLKPGQSWSYRADRKGEFAYICTLHPTMRATLSVR